MSNNLSQGKKDYLNSDIFICERLQPDVLKLFEDILNSGSSIRVRATGKSMSPFLKGGETMTIRKVSSSSLRIGDLIFFKRAYGSPALHRIMKKEVSADNIISYYTKGDSMVLFDEIVHQDNVIGKVCIIENPSSFVWLRHIDMESTIWRTINYSIALIQKTRAQAYRTVKRHLKIRRELIR